MKKLISVFIILLILLGGYLAWLVMGPSTGFKEEFKYLYISSNNPTKDSVMKAIEKDSITWHEATFEKIADRMDYWRYIKPGKYKINNGASVMNIVRKLKNGQQEPVNLVILKFRTKEALAGAMGRKLECDSASLLRFMNNKDSMNRYSLDSNTAMSILFPNTYTLNWNTTPRKVFNKFFEEHEKVWTAERKQKAQQQNLSPTEAYTLASIIEEETNDKTDKPLMASVYLNRIEKGIPLGADPTVKFALRSFELKRIYEKHTQHESPYNTYRVKGLPPGPICTPTLETLDAVLNASKTEYLFFVASSDFSGKHIFTTSYEDHMKYARLYQEALNELLKQQESQKSAK